MSDNRSDFTPSIPPFRFETSNMVPESCIEASEYIIQCFYHRNILCWEKDKIKIPVVYAHFTYGKLDITTEDLMKKDLTNFTSWKFTKLPEQGQGICLINKKKTNNPSNMHFMAVIKVNKSNTRTSPRFLIAPNDNILVSDISEDTDWDEKTQVKVETATATIYGKDLNSLPNKIFPPPKNNPNDYVVGILTSSEKAPC
jgi:hypothetical protein